MKIETTRDKVVLSAAEVQDILKAHIMEATGRTVHGSIHFQLEPGSDKQATGWCHLNYESEKCT